MVLDHLCESPWSSPEVGRASAPMGASPLPVRSNKRRARALLMTAMPRTARSLIVTLRTPVPVQWNERIRSREQILPKDVSLRAGRPRIERSHVHAVLGTTLADYERRRKMRRILFIRGKR